MSVILTANNATTAVAAGGTVPLGSAVHGYGNAIRLNGDTINLTERGYYSVNFSATVVVTGIEELDITMHQNGTAVAAAMAGATPTAAGDSVNISFPWVIRKSCCCDPTSVSFTAGSAGTFTNVICEVVKL